MVRGGRVRVLVRESKRGGGWESESVSQRTLVWWGVGDSNSVRVNENEQGESDTSD
jgi:hypothetical protein